jgi:hypothetical protein
MKPKRAIKYPGTILDLLILGVAVLRLRKPSVSFYSHLCVSPVLLDKSLQAGHRDSVLHAAGRGRLFDDPAGATG